MAKKQYSLSYDCKRWMSYSGNALIAMTNKVGSGKKITILDFDVQNNTILNAALTSTNAALVSANIGIMSLNSVYANTGFELSPTKLKSSATLPSQIKVKCNSKVDFKWEYQGGSYTQTVTAPAATFTPGSAPSPNFATSSEAFGQKYFVVPSGNNVGYYKIWTNSATALTLNDNLLTSGSTTGYVAYPKVLAKGMSNRFLGPVAGCPMNSMGWLNTMPGSGLGSGCIYQSQGNGNPTRIEVKEGESVAVMPFYDTLTEIVVVDVVIIKGTDRFSYTSVTKSSMRNEALLSIENESGSGTSIFIDSVYVTEVGGVDTPYLQLVPISGVNTVTQSDSTRLYPFADIVKHNTSTDFDANVGSVYIDAYPIPFGVPVSYLSEASGGSPKGFNYLNAKDFLGPQYAVYFPENVNSKHPSQNYHTANGTSFNANILHHGSSIKGGKFAPVVIREGEGIALVSGAESATSFLSMSCWHDLNINITFSVEDKLTPSITLSGLQSNSEVRAYVGTDPSTSVEIAGVELSGTSFAFTHDNVGQDGYIQVFSLGYQPIKISLTYSLSELSIPIQQVVDRQYI